MQPRERSRLVARALRIQRDLVWLERHSTRFPVTEQTVAIESNTELQAINQQLAVTRSTRT